MSAGTSHPPVVVKVGGGALAGGALEDLPEVLATGVPVVLVHGGGASLTRMLDALGIETEFRDGLRVTSEAALEVAEMVFAGKVNKSLVRELGGLGVPAVGLSGTDGPTLLVEPIPGLGRVGEVVEVRTKLLKAVSGAGFVPTLAPLGLGPVGDGSGAFNVNADYAAAAVADALGASDLFLLTDVDGFLEEGRLVGHLSRAEVERHLASGEAAGGMAPKLRSALKASRGGVAARILNGNAPGTLLAALEGKPVGTLVTNGSGG
ncbi:argB: acetylglutamate kinase [Rubrobacter radiotolerans]|uniref:Acetylglutamate kinase n=1 Tax=Rubrobacter radiotolerans TaxID=42256 RepID=A0A023X566_RUBRA|nr:acetylglutamate kinase [Rubrobacter radiotolerans]AHY47582.1 argB: acetylglutamate kinase [Rubrobacter radiotolerans]MDX5894987.1 acetylglutamate kinase [Rubrobacter radiotolerans]SMC07212.1 N-acetylglutamate kinase [Rubrobacter radiotolerans DSM 5868]